MGPPRKICLFFACFRFVRPTQNKYLKWPQMGPGLFFPIDPDLADILGDMDFDFENFYFLRFFGLPAWARLGPSLGPPCAQLGPSLAQLVRSLAQLGPGLGPAGSRLGPAVGPPWARLGPQLGSSVNNRTQAEKQTIFACFRSMDKWPERA